MIKKTRILISLAAVSVTTCSLAWEPTTHVYLAEIAINEALTSPDNKVTLYATDYLTGKILRDAAGNRIIFGRYEVNADMLRAIRANRQTYFAGVCGPDAFPDMMTGQEMIHPAGKITPFQNRVIGGPDSSMPDINRDLPSGPEGPGANKWLTHIYNCAFNQAPDGSTRYNTDENKAFVAGFLAHAAGDMFGHTFINYFTGAPFNFRGANGFSGNAVKHVLTEQYVLSKTPALLDVNDYDIKLAGGAPNFIYDNMIRNDSTWYLKGTGLLEGAGLSKALSVPYQYSRLRDSLKSLVDKEAAGQLSIAQEALFTLNPFLKPYINAWIKDIDSGLKALPPVSLELVKSLTMHPRAGVDNGGVQPSGADDILLHYTTDHLLSMSGLPDFVGSIAGDVLKAKDVIRALRTMALDITGLADLAAWIDNAELAVMNKVTLALTGKSYTDWQNYVHSPATYFDSIDNSDSFNQDGGYKLAQSQFDTLMNLNNGKLDWENFAPAFNTVQMIKLTLLSANGYHQLMSDLGGAVPSTNPILGYMETLDGSNQWKANSNKMPLATNPAWYRLLFMNQPGEIAYPNLDSLALTPVKSASFNAVKGVINLPSTAADDTYINVFAKPINGDTAATMTLPDYYVIPRGQSSAQFTEVHPGVRQTTTFELRVVSGNQKVGQFTVNPPSLADFALLSEQQSSNGGSEVTLSTSSVSEARLYLDAGAPIGGVKVDLKSSDPTVISVPSTVTFAPGYSILTFKPTPGANYKAGSSVKLTAHYAGFTDVSKTINFQFTTGVTIKLLGSVRSSKETMRVQPSVTRLGQISSRQNVANFAQTGSVFLHQ